jgi:RNA polymerase sigma-70 factor (ECF subfamily)
LPVKSIIASASDVDLVGMVAAGETSALEVLYERYAPSVLGFMLKIIRDRETGEDLLQEVFVRVWSRAASFELGRGSFPAWLYSIARNLCISRLRQQKARPQIDDGGRRTEDGDWEAEDPLDNLPDASPALLDTIWTEERSRLVREALATLPYEQRMVIELSYFEGLTRREIAARLGWAEGTVHTRARLGLQKLASYLAAQGLGPEDVGGAIGPLGRN